MDDDDFCEAKDGYHTMIITSRKRPLTNRRRGLQMNNVIRATIQRGL